MVDDEDRRWKRNRRPDWATLVVGLLTIAVSSYIIGDGFPGLGIQWILAVGAVSIGVIMLVLSVRSNRER